MYYKLVKDQTPVSNQDFKVFLEEESKVCHTSYAKKPNCIQMYIVCYVKLLLVSTAKMLFLQKCTIIVSCPTET